MSKYEGLYTFDVDSHKYIPVGQADGIIDCFKFNNTEDAKRKIAREELKDAVKKAYDKGYHEGFEDACDKLGASVLQYLTEYISALKASVLEAKAEAYDEEDVDEFTKYDGGWVVEEEE